jgi:hypothetical protein
MQAFPTSGPAYRRGAAQGGGRPIEGREQAVSGRVDLVAVVAFQRHPRRLVVCGEHISPGDVAQSFRHRRRVNEIGEQQRDQRPVVCAGEPESREGPQPRPLDLDARLVPEGVPVMTGRDFKDVLRPELERGPVAHHDLEPARQYDPHVTRLAPVPADMWTHVRGPPPSWLRHNPPHTGHRRRPAGP